MSQITAWALISFTQLLSRLLNNTSDYMRLAFIYMISIHESTSYLDVVLSWILLDVFLSIFSQIQAKKELYKTFFTSSFITLPKMLAALDVYMRRDVYSRPGVYFCYDVVCPWRLNGIRHLYKTSCNSGQYGKPMMCVL